MRKPLKTKAAKSKPVNWSARRAKALMAYRTAGKAANCSK